MRTQPRPETLPLPQWIDVTEIEHSPFQPRSTMNPDALKEFALDLAKDGIQSPPHVRPVRGKAPIKYQLVFGHRRFEAAKLAGFSRIPAVVRADLEHDDFTAARLAYKENADIEPISDYDDARALFALWEAYGEISQSEFCRRINRTPQYVVNRRNMLELPDDLVPIAQSHEGVMTQLIEINQTRGELRQELIEGFDDGKRLSVKTVRETIAHHKQEKREERANYTAPDTETHQRQLRAAEQGSAPLSRGHQVTGHSTKEATAAAQDAVINAHGNLETARQWIEQGGRVPHSELLTLRARVEALLDLHQT